MQVEIVFTNEKGQKYVWRPKTARADLTTAEADRLAAAVAAIEIGRPEEDNPWKPKGHARFVETPPRSKKKPKQKRNKAATSTTRPRERAWVFTPAEVERLKYDTLVGRLKDLWTKDAPADTYLMYMRMLKTIYNSKELEIDRRIEARDFSYDLAKIFSYGGKWSDQMIAAFPELKYLLEKPDFIRCSKQWGVQKKARDRQLKKEVINDTTVSDEASEDTEETAEISQESKSKGKHKSAKVKKYLHNAKKTGRKKPRNDLFF